MKACLVVSCEDRPGIVAAVSGFLFGLGANITALDQHSTNPGGGNFFMRLEFEAAGLPVALDELGRRFAAEVAPRLGGSFRLRDLGRRPRVALLVSRHDHALLDLLWNVRRGDLFAEVTRVVSNHPDLAEVVSWFGIPFHHVPAEPMEEAERRMLELVRGVDLVVLARYMRILSGRFLRELRAPVINVHHSFLPAFQGADPYRQALERGVKLIGASAHYVVEALDAGPIIEQAVRPASHRESLDDLKRLGREIECQVLTRAVRWHLEERVLIDGHKTTVVFR